MTQTRNYVSIFSQVTYLAGNLLQGTPYKGFYTLRFLYEEITLCLFYNGAGTLLPGAYLLKVSHCKVLYQENAEKR